MAKKRRRLRWGRLLALLLVLVLLLGGIAAGGFYLYVKWRVDRIKPTAVLIIGLDAKIGKTNRNDALILTVVDPKQHKVELLAIPRDSYVEIPCENDQKDKITHAYVFGERACTMGAVKQTFELTKLDNYITLNFDQMIALIDLIDGVELTPSKTFCQKGTDKKEYCFTAKEKIQVNGQMALAYSRQRKIDNDIYRGQRQLEVIMAMVEKAKTLSIWELYPLVKEGLEVVETDLDIVQIAAFYRAMKAEDFQITTSKIKGSDSYHYSPGYDGTLYMFEINGKWLKEYRAKLQELLAP